MTAGSHTPIVSLPPVRKQRQMRAAARPNFFSFLESPTVRTGLPISTTECGKSLTDMLRDGSSRGCCIWPGSTQQALASLWCWTLNILLPRGGRLSQFSCFTTPPDTIAWALLAPSASPEMISFPFYKPDAWKHLILSRTITTTTITISISISFCSRFHSLLLHCSTFQGWFAIAEKVNEVEEIPTQKRVI